VKTKAFAVIACILLIWTCWAAEDRQRIAIVLESSGNCTRHAKGDISTRVRPLKALTAVRCLDTIEVAKGAWVRLSFTNTGQRLRLSGPLKCEIPLDGKPPTGKGIQLEANQASRAAIAASAHVDLTKFGGAVGRPPVWNQDWGVPVLTDSPQQVTLDLKLIESDQEVQQVTYRLANQDTAPLLHQKATQKGSQIRFDGPEMKPGQAYRVWFGDVAQGDSPFCVCLLEEKDVAAVRKLEASAKSVSERIECLATYQGLQLFDHAQRILDQLKSELPEADWESYQNQLEQDRRTRNLNFLHNKVEASGQKASVTK
jgi:hypothetical protein